MGFKLFLYLAAILCVSSSVNGLKCYTCTSSEISSCRNDVKSQKVQHCSPKEPVCVQLYGDDSYDATKSLVYRSCESENYCKHAYVGNRDLRNVECKHCREDFCNNKNY